MPDAHLFTQRPALSQPVHARVTDRAPNVPWRAIVTKVPRAAGRRRRYGRKERSGAALRIALRGLLARVAFSCSWAQIVTPASCRWARTLVWSGCGWVTNTLSTSLSLRLARAGASVSCPSWAGRPA